MDLIGILGQAKTVRDDIASGKFVQAWQDTIPLQLSLIDLGREIGFQAAPGDDEKAKDLKCCLDEICVLCEHPPVCSEPVGKLGDGKFLKFLAEFIKEIAPILIPLIIHV